MAGKTLIGNTLRRLHIRCTKIYGSRTGVNDNFKRFCKLNIWDLYFENLKRKIGVIGPKFPSCETPGANLLKPYSVSLEMLILILYVVLTPGFWKTIKVTKTFKEGNSCSSSINRKQLVHKRHKAGNNYHTQDNPDTRENPRVWIGVQGK